MPESAPRSKHVLAVLSGKGGSGKTMIATRLAAMIAEHSERPVVLVDADFGTAGMTYYLGVRYVDNSRYGISSLLLERSTYAVELGDNTLNAAIRPVKGFQNLRFLGIGDPRKLEQLEGARELTQSIAELVGELTKHNFHVVVDCRGGIDPNTVAICSVADDIILITEPDITAYQATRNVVNVLSDERLSHKLRGFVLNKVFQNPSYVRAQGTAEFGCRSLGSVAFDLDATRAFFIGDIPENHTTFASQLANVCYELYSDIMPNRPYRAWSDSDFDKVSAMDIDAQRGGYVVILSLGVLASAYIALYKSLFGSQYLVWSAALFMVLIFLGMVGSSTAFRRALGRVVSIYVRIFAGRARLR